MSSSVGSLLGQSVQKLQQNKIPSARLDVLVLLEDMMGKDRSWILAHPEIILTKSQLRKFRRQIDRRSAHEPLSYIRGFTEFYGRKFKVNKHVLVPRPETETMLELLLKFKLPTVPKIADIGTGCGAIGITAALEIPGSVVDLYDIDSGALAVARHNEHMHELKLGVYKRDLLNRVSTEYDVILANPPYVPTAWKINEAAKAEPKHAIFGGKDGLDLYRRLFKQLSDFEKKPIYVLCEALPPQHSGLEAVANESGFKKIRSKDFILLFGPI